MISTKLVYFDQLYYSPLLSLTFYNLSTNSIMLLSLIMCDLSEKNFSTCVFTTLPSAKIFPFKNFPETETSGNQMALTPANLEFKAKHPSQDSNNCVGWLIKSWKATPLRLTNSGRS